MPSGSNNTPCAAAPQIDQRHTPFRLFAAPSSIHRWGVYAAEEIPAKRKVIEYTGERIARRETKKRLGKKLNYIFALDGYWAIDGGVGGSGAEFINHSCEPNLRSWICKGHILYMSLRPIRRGEELLVDYRFDPDRQRVGCKCGSSRCRVTINLAPGQE